MTLYLMLFEWWAASCNRQSQENQNTTQLFDHMEATLPDSQRARLDFVLSI